MKYTSFKATLYRCPAHFPFWFASHTWFVCNNKRYEVLYTKNTKNPELGFIHLKTSKVCEGLRCFSFLKKPKWKPVEVKKYTQEQSEELSRFLESSVNEYPYKNIYRLQGPNSNTYTAWILKQTGLSKKDMPLNAFGKGYRVK